MPATSPVNHLNSTSSYRVIRSSRTTLSVCVYPDGELIVRSPTQCTDQEIKDYVASKTRWIVKTLLKFSEMPEPLALGFSDGESHAYLGALYPLRLNIAKRRSVNIEEDCFCLNVLPRDGEIQIRSALTAWYRQQAEVVFLRRLDFCFQAFSEAPVKKPELAIRKMKSRWGSCSSKGKVTLNLELMKHPIHVIDYVITHELCHLIEFNHSPRFYELMAQAIPHWKKAKDDLEKGVLLYGAL
jgi:predicted metal-dependent hydrolase